jgi:hypothetical protein
LVKLWKYNLYRRGDDETLVHISHLLGNDFWIFIFAKESGLKFVTLLKNHHHTISDDGNVLNLLGGHIHSKGKPVGMGRRFLPHIPEWIHIIVPLTIKGRGTEISVLTKLSEHYAIIHRILPTSFMNTVAEVNSSILEAVGREYKKRNAMYHSCMKNNGLHKNVAFCI